MNFCVPVSQRPKLPPPLSHCGALFTEAEIINLDQKPDGPKLKFSNAQLTNVHGL